MLKLAGGGGGGLPGRQQISGVARGCGFTSSLGDDGGTEVAVGGGTDWSESGTRRKECHHVRCIKIVGNRGRDGHRLWPKNCQLSTLAAVLILC